MAPLRALLILLPIIIFLTDSCESGFVLPIGGMFNKQTLPSSRTAFAQITQVQNTYSGRTISTNANDSYSTALDLCKDTSDGRFVVALIDGRPTDGICDSACLLCNKYKIAHLATTAVPPDSLSEDLFTFLYHPPPELVSKAYATLIKNVLEWDKFTILYEDDSSFLRLQEIANTWPHDHHPILYRKLNPAGDNLETFKYIFKVAHMSYHVLDCALENIELYMKQIIQVENSTQYQSFVLTNLDSYKVDFEKIPELMANVSTLHLTQANDIRWKDIGINPERTKLETALTADALNHLEKAMRAMQSNKDATMAAEGTEIKFDDAPSLCTKESFEEYKMAAWSSGDDLREALMKTTAKGFTGNIEFDDERKRTNFVLHYSKLNIESQFIYAGYWDSQTDQITTEKTVTDRSTARPNSILRIVTKKDKPYFDTIEYPNGTQEQEGYAVDLIKAIFNHMKVNQSLDLKYYIYRVAGDKLGNQIDGTNKWDGIIGDLMEHNADLAVCDITITSTRNSVVDFSTPFMSLGISMLFREEDPIPPDMFSFIQPLALDVWLYTVTSYIIVSIILLICARMSQGDWVNPHPCNQTQENLQNIWSLYNCLWLTMGSIMTQGCDILPRAGGSRWITGMWWFFALIVTSSYTANMSTFLSNNRRKYDISDVKALSEQNTVSYGAMLNGSTYNFFKSSNESVYQKIWQVMDSAKPKVFTNTNDEGRDRVLRSKGKYVFFMESTAIEYYTNRFCDLKMVGPKLDSKEYGIAMPKNSPLRQYVDTAILSLQEHGVLDDLKKLWWEEKDNDGNCDKQKKKEENKDDTGLQMENTSGIFLMLAVGGVLGVLVSIIDFMLHAHKICVTEKITFRQAIISEWRASLNPRTVHKPAAPPRSAAASVQPSPERERSQSRAVSVLRAASSFINFEEIY